ncbi:MAG TPA: hypothetical protein VMH23_14825 [Bacteroidota bacterium]|nr:hypothetical protein [Bacteroidota bacterium]
MALASSTSLKLSEFVALVHHETQQVIEYLAQPERHLISQESPSAGFVKIEKMELQIPVKVLTQSVNVTAQELAKLPILARPFLRPEGKASILNVTMQQTKNVQTTSSDSILRIELSVASK